MKLRHLEVKYLWLQEMTKRGVIVVRKISGRENPADVLTKPVSFADMLDKLAGVQVVAKFGHGSKDLAEGGCRRHATHVRGSLDPCKAISV